MMRYQNEAEWLAAFAAMQREAEAKRTAAKRTQATTLRRQAPPLVQKALMGHDLAHTKPRPIGRPRWR